MKRYLQLTVVIISLAILSGSAKAAFISSLSGNSRMSGGAGTLRSLVNFAVYENLGSDWRADLGVTSTSLAGTVTGAENYVFLYQITRDTAAIDTNAALLGFSLPTALLNDTKWLSAGRLDGTVFSDGAAVVGAGSGLNTLGAPAAAGASVTGSPPTGFLANGAALNPAFVGTLSASPTFSWLGVGGIGTGGHSSVFFAATGALRSFDIPLGFLTLGNVPATGSASGFVPADGASAPIPVANPEPGSLFLLSIGMLGGVCWRMKKNRKKATGVTESAT